MQKHAYIKKSIITLGLFNSNFLCMVADFKEKDNIFAIKGASGVVVKLCKA